MLARGTHAFARAAACTFGGRYGRVPPPFDPAPEEHRVELGRISLSYLRWRGEGPLLLFVHGLQTNAWVWARVAQILWPEWDIVAVSQRGHGLSEAREHGYALEETTADLLAFLDHLGANEFHLVGHSWGGKVAMHLAATIPERVRTLTLADPVPPRGMGPPLGAHPALVESILEPERGPFATRAAFVAGAKRLVYMRAGDALDERLWREGFREACGAFEHVLPRSAFQEIVRGPMATDLAPLLARIKAPVRLLRPSLTLNMLPSAIAPFRTAGLEFAVRRIPGDHSFIHTNPFDTADALRDFLRAA